MSGFIDIYGSWLLAKFVQMVHGVALGQSNPSIIGLLLAARCAMIQFYSSWVEK